MKTLIRASFISFILICLFSLTAAFNIVSGLTDISSAQDQDYRVITVAAGDTLWTLADEYMSDYNDPREAVYEIKQLNNIDSQIYAGEEIRIPVN